MKTLRFPAVLLCLGFAVCAAFATDPAPTPAPTPAPKDEKCQCGEACKCGEKSDKCTCKKHHKKDGDKAAKNEAQKTDSQTPATCPAGDKPMTDGSKSGQ